MLLPPFFPFPLADDVEWEDEDMWDVGELLSLVSLFSHLASALLLAGIGELGLDRYPLLTLDPPPCRTMRPGRLVFKLVVLPLDPAAAAETPSPMQNS